MQRYKAGSGQAQWRGGRRRWVAGQRAEMAQMRGRREMVVRCQCLSSAGESQSKTNLLCNLRLGSTPLGTQQQSQQRATVRGAASRRRARREESTTASRPSPLGGVGDQDEGAGVDWCGGSSSLWPGSLHACGLRHTHASTWSSWTGQDLASGVPER